MEFDASTLGMHKYHFYLMDCCEIGVENEGILVAKLFNGQLLTCISKKVHFCLENVLCVFV